MPSITLYQTGADAISSVRALLVAAGLALDGELQPPDAPACLNSNPVLLVLLDASLSSDAEFEDAMIAATNAGRRIIGIWPEGSNGDLPAAFKKYSTDQVIWNPKRVRKAICDMNEPIYDTPDGTPQDPPHTDRNC